MRDHVLVRDAAASSGGRGTARPEATTAWVVVAVVGIALAIIGWVDILLAWYPPQFGTVEWEFGTISTTIDSLPLATMGLSAFAVAAIARGSPRHARTAGMVCWLIAAGLLGALALYLLDVPVAWKGVKEVLRPVLGKAILRTSLMTLSYTALYGWLGWFTWRRWRADR